MGIGDLVEHENDAARRLDIGEVERLERSRFEHHPLVDGVRAKAPGQRLSLDDVRTEARVLNIRRQFLGGGLRRKNIEELAFAAAQSLAHGVKAIERDELGGGPPERVGIADRAGGPSRLMRRRVRQGPGAAPRFRLDGWPLIGPPRRLGARAPFPARYLFAIARHAGLSWQELQGSALFLSRPPPARNRSVEGRKAGDGDFRLTAAGPVRISAFTKVLTTGPLGECPERQRGRTVNPLATPS